MASPDKPAVNEISKDQVGGDHYSTQKISPWDIQLAMGVDVFVSGRICDVLKYVMRNKENRLEDLKKARHAIGAAIRVLEQEQTNNSPT